MTISTDYKRAAAGQMLFDFSNALNKLKLRASQIRMQIESKKAEMSGDPDFTEADAAEANVVIANAQAIEDAY